MGVINLSGKKFGILTVADHYMIKNKRTYWLCKCECGTEKYIYSNSLKSGLTQSCGCLQKEKIKKIGHRNKTENNFKIQGDKVILYTNKNEEIIFDLEYLEKIKKYCWYIGSDGYASTTIYPGKIKLLFHRLIMNCEDGKVVDHMNHNRLDNRKSNLRIVSQKENMKNLKKYKNNTSGVTGVYWDKRNKIWTAKIRDGNKLLNLGNFKNKEDAIRKRKEYEKILGFLNIKGDN